MLAQAIQALESPEHDADVSEAEAIRNRLLDLDAAIGDRIQAKLDAHRLIVDSWGVSEAIIPRRLDTADEPIVEITDPLAAFDADAEREPSGVAVMLQENIANKWAKHHETFHTSYAQIGDEITEPVLEMSVAEIQQDDNRPD
jgi:hypothetical protein